MSPGAHRLVLQRGHRAARPPQREIETPLGAVPERFGDFERVDGVRVPKKIV
jgi:hypothetical protein